MGTSPAGSEWTKNPVPNCAGLGGGYMNPDPAVCPQGYQVTLSLLEMLYSAALRCPQFPPPLPDVFGQGANIDGDTAAYFEWTVMDELVVPAELEPGKYVLSFRWDCEQTPQVRTSP